MRIFKVVHDLAGDEIYSSIRERQTDTRAESKFRLRRRPANPTVLLSVEPALPPGGFSPAPAQGARALQWAALEAWETLRRVRFDQELLPEGVDIPPPGDVQPGLAARARVVWEAEVEAWTTARRRRVLATHNDVMSFYAQAEWGEPIGNILEEIQRHMLEPFSNLGQFWYDELWDTTEVLRYARDRVNEFLLQTGVDRQVASQAVGVGAKSIVAPSDSNVIRRAVWFAVSGASSPLELGDFHKADESDPGWEADSGVPERLILWGRGKAELHPIPAAAGTLLIDYVPLWDLTIPVGDYHLNPSAFYEAVTTLVPLPPTFMPFIKYGIMADMLAKEGEAHDENRATYCEGRFQEGIEIAKMWMGRRD